LILDENSNHQEVNIVKLYHASLEDGSTIAEIDINERFGKLYNDDTRYAAKYHPLYSANLKYSEILDKVAILATRE
jgi:hypothetical protein